MDCLDPRNLQAVARRVRFPSGDRGGDALLRWLLGLAVLLACMSANVVAAEGPGLLGQPWVLAEAAAACTRHADCSDGNVCNGLEICRKGVCASGQRLECSSLNPCVLSICDPRSGCRERSLSGDRCDDGNLCTTGGVCRDGRCVAEGKVTCRDEGPCVIGICEPASGCSTRAARDGSVCDDGREDTRNDSCQAGLCRGEGIDPLILEQMEDDKLFDFQQDPDYDPS